jgi:hypothetical protein
LPAKLGQTVGEAQSFLLKHRGYAGAAARAARNSGRAQHRSIRAAEISYHSLDGAKSKGGPSMTIKFEGKPPFYLGIAEVASAHALDGSVVLRATISVPEMRPKSVPVQFIVATDVAKALAEQLPIAVRMAEAQKQRGG